MRQENGRVPEGREDGTDLPSYRLIQLEWNAQRGLFNDSVPNFEELVTHHPHANRNATIQNGVVAGGEPGRRHGMVGGEVQEIEVATPQNTYGLGPDQVLLKKDFMLEDSRIPSGGAGVRNVDVPSPIAGYVGNVYPAQGRVDILDREGGEVIARVRHMSNIQVERGDTIEYGQALGTQSNVATRAVHVHLEMDTRYHQQYENYIGDIASGRLAIDPARRTEGIEARPVVDDGIIRIGESSDRVRDAQRFLSDEGYRGRGNQPLAQDGVYRLDMQPAVLNFQAARGLPQSGDLDAATLALVPAAVRREQDRADHADGLRPPEGAWRRTAEWSPRRLFPTCQVPLAVIVIPPRSARLIALQGQTDPAPRYSTALCIPTTPCLPPRCERLTIGTPRWVGNRMT